MEINTNRSVTYKRYIHCNTNEKLNKWYKKKSMLRDIICKLDN